jgi:hypothetical protein
MNAVVVYEGKLERLAVCRAGLVCLAQLDSDTVIFREYGGIIPHLVDPSCRVPAVRPMVGRLPMLLDEASPTRRLVIEAFTALHKSKAVPASAMLARTAINVLFEQSSLDLGRNGEECFEGLPILCLPVSQIE